MKNVFLLAKIFENQKYMQDFCNGKLYMNSLAYFKDIEIINDKPRYDSYEGIRCYWQPQQCILELNGHKFNNLIAPITLYSHSNNYKNVFCMWSISSENDILRGNIYIDEENKKFGEYLVVITSPKIFLERITSALQNSGLSAQVGLVEYYDEKTHLSFEENKEVFHKVSNFSYQQEYRIAVNTNIDNKPYILNIGNLEDISIILTIDEFNQNIALKSLEN